MDLERQLYDKFVAVLNEKLDGEPSAQDLAVVLNFLKHNNIQATNKHTGVNELTNKAKAILPFEDEDIESQLPAIKRVK